MKWYRSGPSGCSELVFLQSGFLQVSPFVEKQHQKDWLSSCFGRRTESAVWAGAQCRLPRHCWPWKSLSYSQGSRSSLRTGLANKCPVSNLDCCWIPACAWLAVLWKDRPWAFLHSIVLMETLWWLGASCTGSQAWPCQLHTPEIFQTYFGYTWFCWHSRKK